MTISAGVFDIDGTLVDSVDLHARAWRDAFLAFGKDVPLPALRAQMGKGGDQLMPLFLSQVELEKFGEEMEAYRGALYKRDYLPQVRAFPGGRALFQRLKADGIALALASSARADELGIYKRLAQIEDLVQVEVSADDAARSKPHPDIFRAALAALGNPAAGGVLVVGDSPYDAQAAGKLGLRTIGVLSGGFPEDWLRESGAVAIYRDLVDLLARYEQSPFHEQGQPTQA